MFTLTMREVVVDSVPIIKKEFRKMITAHNMLDMNGVTIRNFKIPIPPDEDYNNCAMTKTWSDILYAGNFWKYEE